jgi:hypothetical protein
LENSKITQFSKNLQIDESSNGLPESSNGQEEMVQNLENEESPINNLKNFVKESFGVGENLIQQEDLTQNNEENLTNDEPDQELVQNEENLDQSNELTQNLMESNENGLQLCQKCNVRKIYRNNLCYRCRGSGGNTRSSEYHKQVDEQFVSRVRFMGYTG